MVCVHSPSLLSCHRLRCRLQQQHQVQQKRRYIRQSVNRCITVDTPEKKLLIGRSESIHVHTTSVAAVQMSVDSTSIRYGWCQLWDTHTRKFAARGGYTRGTQKSTISPINCSMIYRRIRYKAYRARCKKKKTHTHATVLSSPKKINRTRSRGSTVACLANKNIFNNSTQL